MPTYIFFWGFQGVGLLHTTVANYIAPEECDASSVFSLNMKSLLMLVRPKYEGNTFKKEG